MTTYPLSALSTAIPKQEIVAPPWEAAEEPGPATPPGATTSRPSGQALPPFCPDSYGLFRQVRFVSQ